MGDWAAGVLFVAIAAAAVGSYVSVERRLTAQGYRRRAPLPPAPSPPPELAATASRFRGGVRMGRWNASLPMARLELDGDHAHVRALAPAVLGPDRSAWIARAGVDEVRPVRTPLGSGIRFTSAAGTYDAVVFWTGFTAASIEPVLATFRAHGWPVAARP